ncbi:MAG: histidine phosphatase family protein [Syntrophobacteraceae bacterium]|nr:histidine phosphatase family protein [Syntrophobacteraceae bacterium]
MVIEKRGKIAALVLAAGYSSRMGAFKPLLPLGESTVVQEVVERFRRAGLGDVRVVVGHRAEETGAVVDRLGAGKIGNTAYDKGMYSSVLAGVKSLEPEIEAFFVLPVDIPLIKPATIASLAAAWRGSAAKVAYPRFEGLRGHPPIISTELTADLPQDYPGGLAAFLARYDDLAVDLDVIDQSILMNCNTRLDYLKLRAYRSREDIPTDRECIALLKAQNGSQELIAHSLMVAEMARMLAVFLLPGGLALNFELVKAGGLLHDIAKGQHPDHAAAGAEFLEKIGCGRVARLVALHTDIGPGPLQPPGESEVVHFADKLVKGDRVVTLTERFEGPLKRFADRAEVLAGVKRRLRDAKTISRQLEKILGRPPQTIFKKYEKSMRAGLSGGKTIYLARHGAIKSPQEAKRYIGHTDLPLTAEGLRQARELAEKLRPTRLSAIFSSDLGRSFETAKIVASLHGLSPTALPGFREVALGDWEGLSFEAVRSRYPEEYEKRGLDIVTYRPPGGESFLDCARRVLPTFYDAVYSTPGDILIVAHAGVNRLLLCHVLGKPLSELFDIEQDYCCLNRIGLTACSFELASLNEPLPLPD